MQPFREGYRLRWTRSLFAFSFLSEEKSILCLSKNTVVKTSPACVQSPFSSWFFKKRVLLLEEEEEEEALNSISENKMATCEYKSGNHMNKGKEQQISQ